MATPSPIDMDEILIRRAKIDDVEAIGDLWVSLAEFHRELDPRLPVPAENGGKVYARRIGDRLEDSHTGVLVAEYQGEVIGFVLGLIVDLVPEMFRQQVGGFLADIYVDEAYRRCGVGRRLVDAMEDWFRSRGVQYMEWYVATENPVGRQFWQAIGGRDIMTRMRVQL